MESKFDFLFSVRFWKLAVIGLLAGAAYLYPASPYLHAASIVFSVWFGGSVLVGTADKFSRAKVQAAVIEAGSTAEPIG